MKREVADAVVDFIARPSLRSAEPLRVFHHRDWERNHHWLVTSGLALYLLRYLQDVGADSLLPAKYRAHLQGLYDASGVRTTELLRDLLAINREFTRLGIPFANWKGFALQPDFCPDIRLRPQLDFDFIIPSGKTENFGRVLEQLGYMVSGRITSETRYELDPSSQYSLDDVYRPKPHRKIELHAGADLLDSHGHEYDLSGVLNRRIRTVLDGVEIPVLEPVDAFLAHAIHAGKHSLYGWVRLSWLLELDTFIARQSDCEALWDSFRQRADVRSLTAVGVALVLTEQVWRRPVPDFLRWATNSLPAETAQFLAVLGRDLAFGEFPGNKLNVLLNRTLMDAAAFRRWERSVVFPLHKPPRVSHAAPQAAARVKTRAAKHQVAFVFKRIRFHVVEGLRYMRVKRAWDRRVTQP